MKHFAKKLRQYAHFTLIGLFALAFPISLSLQVQTFGQGQNFRTSSIKQDSFAPAVLVPDGAAVITSSGFEQPGGNGTTLRIVNVSQFGSRWASHVVGLPVTAHTHSPEYISLPGLMPLIQSWVATDFQGQSLHGLAVSTNGNTIYVAAHHSAGTNRIPNIYRITDRISLVATLPGARGIGAIDLDETHKLIFASNIDDGKIYRVDLKAEPPSFSVCIDPFQPDTGSPNLPPLGERLIAVAYHRQQRRVYYGVWGVNGVNSIRSIHLNSAGQCELPTDKLEINLPRSLAPPGDIEFNRVGDKMLVAEEPIDNGPVLGGLAHTGRGLGYIKHPTTGRWLLDPIVYGTGPPKYEIGRHLSRTNTRGGVTWVYSVPTGNHNNGNEHFTLWTGDALRFDTVFVYGLQFTPSPGGSAGSSNLPSLLPSNSLIADLDYNVDSTDTYIYGDVDMRRSPNYVVLRSSDFNGDFISDVGVFRPPNGFWYINFEPGLTTTEIQFGANGDSITPEDYDGDGKTDISVFRPANGTWYRLNSSNNSFAAVQFGLTGDLPVPADYDGDARADITVFRPADGSWYRINSSDGEFIVNQFGTGGDKPTLGDFDGDGKADLALFRPSNATWYRINSNDEFPEEIQFGAASDKPVPADYDGDGKTDLALFRPANGTWYRINSSNELLAAEQFGINGDIPVPGDYDGDGESDLGVFRPATGTWHLLRSTEGLASIQFGTSGDIPIPSAYIR